MSTCDQIFQQLKSTITTLTDKGAGFNGDAAVGYVEFFTQITPVLVDRLTSPDGSLCSNLKKLLSQIGEALLDTVDPAMGEQNRGAVGDGTGAT